MVEPVLISSGILVDRSTAIDPKKLSLGGICPITKKKLEGKVYNATYMEIKIKEW